MEDCIARDHYLKKLQPYIHKNLIKVFVGQRRVGKSYLLYQVMDTIRNDISDPHILYINKELHDFNFIKTHDDLTRYVHQEDDKGKKRCYVFIDEIQDIESFEKSLRSLLAEGRYDLYITGSNANLLSGELATHLSGRHVEITVYGLSYPEFLKFHNLENLQETFISYMKYGGLPFLIHLPMTDEIVYDYLKNIYSTILFRDVVQRHSIRNTDLLERLVEFLAGNTGSLVSAKRISDYLKSQKISLSPNMVLQYLTFLHEAFFVSRVKRIEVTGKKIFEVIEKFYFEDLGLRHTIAGYRQSDINGILENMVYSHLLVSGYSVYVGEMKTGEIDFVCFKGSEKLYVQVVYLLSDDKVYKREFGNLKMIQDNYEKLVISMDEVIGESDEGIHHMHIRDFLSDYR